MSDPFPLSALRAFESAARHESFARAAAELSVTPSAVSHRIRDLETVLGIVLFHRDPRAVRLTDAGRELLPDVTTAFGQLRSALERVRTKDKADVLRISVAPAFASGWLVPRLAHFRTAHPEIEVRLDTSTTLLALPSPDLDAAIRYTAEPARDGLVSHRLFDDEMIAVCAPSVASRLHDLADLADATLLHSFSGCSDWTTWLAAAGASGIDASAGPELASDTLALEAATHGLGVALAHRRVAGTRITDGTLVAPFGTMLLVRHAYHFVHAEALAGQAKVAAFRRWLLDAVAEEESAHPSDIPT